jgi:gluconolactonase
MDRPAERRYPYTWHADDYKTGSIQRVNQSTGAVEDVPLRGPNYIVFDAYGGFWFTDLGKSTDHYRHHSAIYYAWADGSRFVRARTPMVTPNGIGLSPDGRTLCVAETMTSRLWGFGIEERSKLRQPETMIPGKLIVTMPNCQLFDSLAVQADGKVCVATLICGGITIIDPVTGTTEYLDVPDEPFVTNTCFGGLGIRDAWITASGGGNLSHAMGETWACAKLHWLAFL